MMSIQRVESLDYRSFSPVGCICLTLNKMSLFHNDSNKQLRLNQLFIPKSTSNRSRAPTRTRTN